MTTRYILLVALLPFYFASLSKASEVFLPHHSPPVLREFVELFALPMMNSHHELSMHNIALALIPAKTVDGHVMDPGLSELSSRCRIDLEYLHQQHQQLFIAFCSWSASDASSHFFSVQSSAHQMSPLNSTAFAVFGSSVKQIREGLAWLMRHTLLHPAFAEFGWVAPHAAPQPWTSLRSTQLARSMVTMPMPELQQ